MNNLRRTVFLLFGIYFSDHQVCATQNSLVTLRCWNDSIYIEVKNRFLVNRGFEVTGPERLHFTGFQSCHASVVENGFVLTLYPPYINCGTTVQVNNDTYTYSNKVVIVTPTTSIALFSLQCNFDKKYIVSSGTSLTPVMKTLNFLTARGKFDVNMGLYQRSDFNSKSMFMENPSILIGTSVYVAIEITDAFGDSNIVSTLESCYATDNDDYTAQKLYHSLIVNRCSSPGDKTVRIITNGEHMLSGYRFDMFKWETNVEYLYLHCEVKVCNKSVERCSGISPLCTGEKRNDDINLATRRRRDLGGIGDQLKNYGIMTLGPIIVKDKRSEHGHGNYKTLYRPLVRDRKFLEIYINATFSAAAVLIGLIAVVAVIKQRNKGVQAAQ